MTEQEIIEFLKKNKEKGVAFNFMPKEVRDWCCNRPNYFNDFLLYKNGAWRDEYCFVNPSTDLQKMSLNEIIILALPENFELKQKPKGEWVEFEIKNFYFNVNYASSQNRYFWTDWGKMLMESFCCSWGYTAFGGWQYKDCQTWYMYPMFLFGDDHYVPCVFKGEVRDVNPAVPVKIRFWKMK